MDVAQYLDHPLLKPYVKSVSAGNYLFRQGEPGQTMYIIADGIVHLIAERNGDEHVAGILERGQFLGERAVMRDASHRRFFSARAKTHATVLEMARKDLDAIQQADPTIIIDMLKQIFEVAAKRLEMANYVGTILRSSDNYERLVWMIIYFSKTSGRNVPEGVEVLLSVEGIHNHIDMDPEDIESCLKELVSKRVLLNKVNQYFIIPDENRLVKYIAELQKRGTRAAAPEKRKLFSFGG